MAIDKKQCGPRKFGSVIQTNVTFTDGSSPSQKILDANAGRMTIVIGGINSANVSVGPIRLLDVNGNLPYFHGSSKDDIFEFDKYGNVIQEEWHMIWNGPALIAAVTEVYWNS